MGRGSKGGGSGAIARKLALVCGLTAIGVGLLTVAVVAQTLGSGLPSGASATLTRGWGLGIVLAIISGIVVGLAAFVQGSGLGSRLTDLGLGIAKIGRSGADARVRISGNDEITRVGRAVQYLATDLATVAAEAEQSGGALGANTDPQVRAMRDLTLPADLPQVEGFEVDGVLAPGTRGGMEFFDGHVGDDGEGLLFLIAHEGVGAGAAMAARMARDEMMRAVQAGANARKALHHTNRVLHQKLPKGACATACVLALGEDQVKVYQAGFRAPALVCRAGKVEEVHGEGLALGLDAGPVFEKGLRPASVPVSQGVRLVLANDAALRLDEFVDQVQQHAPKHTAPFMNLVLGALEGDAGEGGLREDVIMLTAKRW